MCKQKEEEESGLPSYSQAVLQERADLDVEVEDDQVEEGEGASTIREES